MRSLLRAQRYLAGLALALLLVTATPILADEVQGTIAWIEPDDYTFTLVDDNNNVLPMRLALTGKVTVAGDNETIWDLQPGERAKVTFTERDGTMRATCIEGN